MLKKSQLNPVSKSDIATKTDPMLKKKDLMSCHATKYGYEYCLIRGYPETGPSRTLILTSVRYSTICYGEKA